MYVPGGGDGGDGDDCDGNGDGGGDNGAITTALPKNLYSSYLILQLG